MAAKSNPNLRTSKSKNVHAAKIRTSAPVERAEPLRVCTFQAGFWRTHWLPAMALLALAFALYALSLQYGYILENEMVAQQNSIVELGWTGLRNIFASDSFLGYFKEPKFLQEDGHYRPLSLATFATESGIFGKNNPQLPHISHGINVLLYGLTGIGLYRILAIVFPISEQGRWYFSLPFLGAALFLLHPLHVEVVANIKGRDEILALLGSLGALWATLRYYNSGHRFGWLFVAGASLFLGALANENALSFVAVVPLTMWLLTKIPPKQLLAPTAVLLGAAVLFVALRYQAMGYIFGNVQTVDEVMDNPFLEMTGSERLATIFLTLGWQVKLLFVPHPLTHDYSPYHLPRVGWADWQVLLSLALYLGMGIWAVLNLRKRSVVAWCVLYFLCTLGSVFNPFVPTGTFMSERLAYAPSVAFCVLAAWFFARRLPDLIQEQPDRPSIVGAMLFMAIATLFAWRTATRVPDWRDGLTLNATSVRVSENSAQAHYFYVTSLYKSQYQDSRDLQEKTRLTQEMEYHIKRSLEINPNYTLALVTRSAVALARFDLDHQLDKLFHEFEYVMDRIPYDPNFRGLVDENMTTYLKGANSDKYISFCHRVGYDFFYQQKKDPATALHFLQLALDRQTEDLRVLGDMAEIYTAQGDTVRAAEMQSRAATARNY